MKKYIPVLLIFILQSVSVVYSGINEQKRPNVLFFLVDDLMKQVELYGHPQIKTPELKKLAADGLVFERAYCQLAICGPSRSALLFGQYPEKTSLIPNALCGCSEVKKHRNAGNPTIFDHFKKNGYTTYATGKIFHGWYNPVWHPWLADKGMFVEQGYGGARSSLTFDTYAGKKKSGSPWIHNDATSNEMLYEHKDGLSALAAKGWLSEHAATKKAKPFFMCIGLHKPHSPYSAPKRFFDRYENVDFQLADAPVPQGVNEDYSFNSDPAEVNNTDITYMYDSPRDVPEEKIKKLIHGYAACVSYMDYLVGDVINSLKENGLYENTIIVFTSDNGFKLLREYGRWGKWTLHEVDAAIPLIIRDPRQKSSWGKRTDALVEHVDIYATLSELCGLPLPPSSHGISFSPTVSDPETPARKFARTLTTRMEQNVVGASIITDQGYRYSQYWKGDGWGKPIHFPEEADILEYELFDHYNRNNSYIAQRNLADEYPELVATLRELCAEDRLNP